MRREQILRRFLAADASGDVRLRRRRHGLAQLPNTASIRTSRCGILKQISQLPALFIVLQQVPHTRLLTALAFVLNPHVSSPGLPPGAGHERV